jgi:8-oxo-dGTP pyrophosphatase MutT (NUDIX family)
MPAAILFQISGTESGILFPGICAYKFELSAAHCVEYGNHADYSGYTDIAIHGDCPYQSLAHHTIRLKQTENWILRVSEELLKPLPGADAQLRMAPLLRRPLPKGQLMKKGGVLLLLYPRHADVHTVFIRRTEYGGIHSGQISFPGGIHEEKDLTLEQTALREAMEEIGVRQDEIKIIGRLTSLNIPVSNTDVFPFVGVCSDRPVFNHDQSEVQYLIEVGMDELLNPVNQKRKIMKIAGNMVEVPYFDIRDNHIWGATAMILSEFLEVVKKVMSNE